MKVLTEEQANYWLNQHIRSRIFAAYAQPRWFRPWAETQSPENRELQQSLHFILQASWEGRHAAIRWLIEFVGVINDSEGQPKRSSRKFDDDFRISDLAGTEIALKSAEAEKLASLCYDLNKATSHPTHESDHDTITEERLRWAAQFLASYVNEQLYKPRGMTL